MPCAGVIDHERPDDVAVAADDRVRAAEFVRFVGVERGVYAAEDHRRAARSRGGADLVAAQRVARVDPDPDNVARLDVVEIERLERFVDDAWRAVCGAAWPRRARTASAA